MKNAKRFALICSSLVLLTGTAYAENPLDVAKKNGCLACHAVDKTIVGPAWNTVSATYKHDSAAYDKLMESVLHGSSGKWGNKVHMRSQEQVSKEEASLLVKYILSLSDTAE